MAFPGLRDLTGSWLAWVHRWPDSEDPLAQAAQRPNLAGGSGSGHPGGMVAGIEPDRGEPMGEARRIKSQRSSSVSATHEPAVSQNWPDGHVDVDLT